MTHNPSVITNKRSYVFSQDTLAKAIDTWVKVRIQKASEKEEAFLIVQAALPWFMKHLGQDRDICTFTEEMMLREIDYWKADQMTSWPHQRTRIEETCDLIIDFFRSEVVTEDFKMLIR